MPSTALTSRGYYGHPAVGMTDGQPEPGTDRIRFTGTADIGRMLAGALGVRAALLEEGVPASALSVTADAQLAVLPRQRPHAETSTSSARISMDDWNAHLRTLDLARDQETRSTGSVRGAGYGSRSSGSGRA